jgi:hypothetical protein
MQVAYAGGLLKLSVYGPMVGFTCIGDSFLGSCRVRFLKVSQMKAGFASVKPLTENLG